MLRLITGYIDMIRARRYR